MIVTAWNGVRVDIPWYRMDLIYMWASGRLKYKWHMRRLERMTRRWVAISPHGQVELGMVNYAEALGRASKLGGVSYTDMQYGFIFYNTDLGKSEPK
jgi:hypothetical protein